ncbi:guanine nucleotide-binding protein-like 3 homolog [Orbicella faveolata]|uniref:guanine nucleotide-binding protein-like 3 homolog n=1 Tax=Orbicella faveolata TaxID=48498 RepID=UPI0009E3210B|nr:guanine nucleotide-binding protein-like 3 homolog [Orbicella faveolata]
MHSCVGLDDLMTEGDIFGPVEDNNDEKVEEEEEVEEEEPEEEQEAEEDSNSSEEEEEADDDESDPWSPLRQYVGEDIKETYLKEVQQFLDKGRSQNYAENAAFNALLPVSRRRLRRTYLERLKWTHRIKHDAIHRKVMKTLRRFIEEDDMDFDEAAESAVAKRKFLLKRLMKKKLLPDDDDEEEVEEEA